MNRNKQSRQWIRRPVAAVSFALLLCVACQQQRTTLDGLWVVPGEVLKSGEAAKIILDLKQTGDTVTGTVRGLGFNEPVKGTVKGTHFELFSADDATHPQATGDLVDGNLKGTQSGKPFVAKPGTAADDFPKLAYIEPPALHDVPYNGLAKTPPMGWNSWNLFADKVDDKTVRLIADAMVTSGMRDAGYNYVNIDDTWEGMRGADGVLATNSKFPDMKALADYVHSKGMKIGIYSSPGPYTCGSYPGSYGHEDQDAKMYAAWGIDYLKYDWCSAGTIYSQDKLQPVYQKMGVALQATGRPIVFSLCEYGLGKVETWGPKVGGNLWRTTDDIQDSWPSMIANIEKQVPTAPYAGPGHWNDPDMLEVGNGHMTTDEYRTHMSLWALTAAPLLAGNDIRTMSDDTKSILLNKEVIAVDQDSLGKQASPVKNGDLETWVKPLADGSVAVGVVNLGASPTKATVKTAEVLPGKRAYVGRDLWAHKDVKFSNAAYVSVVPSHGTLMLHISGK
jgi:alpha-galactosidase